MIVSSGDVVKNLDQATGQWAVVNGKLYTKTSCSGTYQKVSKSSDYLIRDVSRNRAALRIGTCTKIVPLSTLNTTSNKDKEPIGTLTGPATITAVNGVITLGPSVWSPLKTLANKTGVSMQMPNGDKVTGDLVTPVGSNNSGYGMITINPAGPQGPWIIPANVSVLVYDPPYYGYDRGGYGRGGYGDEYSWDGSYGYSEGDGYGGYNDYRFGRY